MIAWSGVNVASPAARKNAATMPTKIAAMMKITICVQGMKKLISFTRQIRIAASATPRRIPITAPISDVITLS